MVGLVSIPAIPGYTSSSGPASLSDLWRMPPGDYPGTLWPVEKLSEVRQQPSSWITVAESSRTDSSDSFVRAAFVPDSFSSTSLNIHMRAGDRLGEFGVWSSGEVDNGLYESEEPYAEFVAQARHAVGSDVPQIEVSLPLLWCWDAYRTKNGWSYLDSAGRDHELVRASATTQSYKIEVRSSELQTFMATCGLSLAISVQYTNKCEAKEFERVDDEFQCEWGKFEFAALHDPIMGDLRAYSITHGAFLVKGQRTSRTPRWDEHSRDYDYPEFIYGVSIESGQNVTHTCNPDLLGTYFDKDGSRLHYLTPIYFKREVLHPYTAQPNRYRVSAGRISCLNLWGMEFSFNSAGLVEAYLGDLGRDLPAEEWGHWKSYNVPPEGRMDEGRFRRDFLNQSVATRDPLTTLRRAVSTADESALRLLGGHLWNRLPDGLTAEYSSHFSPLTSDAAALNGPLLVLTKSLVDALNTKTLKTAVSSRDPGDKSLKLLQSLLQDLGDEEDSSKSLRDLQALRSRGGIAHLENSASRAAAAAMGVEDMGAMDAFNEILSRVTDSLERMAKLFQEREKL